MYGRIRLSRSTRAGLLRSRSLQGRATPPLASEQTGATADKSWSRCPCVRGRGTPTSAPPPTGLSAPASTSRAKARSCCSLGRRATRLLSDPYRDSQTSASAPEARSGVDHSILRFVALFGLQTNPPERVAFLRLQVSAIRPSLDLLTALAVKYTVERGTPTDRVRHPFGSRQLREHQGEASRPPADTALHRDVDPSDPGRLVADDPEESHPLVEAPQTPLHIVVERASSPSSASFAWTYRRHVSCRQNDTERPRTCANPVHMPLPPSIFPRLLRSPASHPASRSPSPSCRTRA